MGLFNKLAKSKAIQEGLEDAERTLTHTKIPTEQMGEETQLALKRLNAEANTPNPMVQDIDTAQKMRDVADKVESYKSPVSEALDRYRAGTATSEDLDVLAKGMGEKSLPTAENPIIIPDSGDYKKVNAQKEASTTLPQEEKGIVPSQSKALTPEVLPVEKAPQAPVSEPLTIDANKAMSMDIDESKLDEAIKKMNPTLWERFKSLPVSQKMAVATSMGLGAYGVSNLINGGGSNQPPVEKAKQAPTAPVKQPEATLNPVEEVKKENDAVSEEIKKLESEINAPEGSKSFVNKLLQAQGTTLGTDSALREAQAKRDQERGYNMLGRAADIATGAVYHTGPKMKELYDQQDKFAERHVEDIKDRIANEKNDPNSSVSKAYNDILSEFGIKAQGLSGAAIEKIAPWVEKKYLAEEARKGRLAELKIKQQELKQQKEVAKQAKDEMRNDDFIFKANQALSKTKPFIYRQKIDNSLNTVEAAIKNPNGVNDIAALYDFVKGLDPDSAVREGEVKLGREALGLWGQIKSDISKAGSNPRLLDTKMLENVRKYLHIAKIGAENQYKSVAGPLLKQAESRGIPQERYGEIDPFNIGLAPKQEQAPQSQYNQGQEAGIQKVMKANNISREQAIAALKQAGKL